MGKSYSSFVSVLGIFEVFVEWGGAYSGWGFDRCWHGVVLTAGKLQITFCVTLGRLFKRGGKGRGLRSPQ